MKPFRSHSEFELVFDRSGCNVSTESKGTDIFGRVVLVGGGEDARGRSYYCEVCVAIVETRCIECCSFVFFPLAYHPMCLVIICYCFAGRRGARLRVIDP